MMIAPRKKGLRDAFSLEDMERRAVRGDAELIRLLCDADGHTIDTRLPVGGRVLGYGLPGMEGSTHGH